MDRYFYSSIYKTRYCLNKTANTLCLFKETKDGREIPVAGKVYENTKSGLETIKRFIVNDDELILPTTTIYRRDNHPGAFKLHKNFGYDIYGTLMNGRVVSVLRNNTFHMIPTSGQEAVPMVKRLTGKLQEYYYRIKK